MDNLNGLPRLLNVRRAAELVGVKPCTTSGKKRLRGRLGFIKIGARIFLHRAIAQRIYRKTKGYSMRVCDPTAQSRVKSGITGSANVLAARAPKMRGTAAGTIKEADRLAEQVLAQQIFKRRAIALASWVIENDRNSRRHQPRQSLNPDCTSHLLVRACAKATQRFHGMEWPCILAGILGTQSARRGHYAQGTKAVPQFPGKKEYKHWRHRQNSGGRKSRA